MVYARHLHILSTYTTLFLFTCCKWRRDFKSQISARQSLHKIENWEELNPSYHACLRFCTISFINGITPHCNCRLLKVLLIFFMYSSSNGIGLLEIARLCFSIFLYDSCHFVHFNTEGVRNVFTFQSNQTNHLI